MLSFVSFKVNTAETGISLLSSIYTENELEFIKKLVITKYIFASL